MTPPEGAARLADASTAPTPAKSRDEAGAALKSPPWPIALNGRWRIIDDPIQWVLQQRTGKSRDKSTGWESRRFYRTRRVLLRDIAELCGYVDLAALQQVRALPEQHL